MLSPLETPFDYALLGFLSTLPLAIIAYISCLMFCCKLKNAAPAPKLKRRRRRHSLDAFAENGSVGNVDAFGDFQTEEFYKDEFNTAALLQRDEEYYRQQILKDMQVAADANAEILRRIKHMEKNE